MFAFFVSAPLVLAIAPLNEMQDHKNRTTLEIHPVCANKQSENMTLTTPKNNNNAPARDGNIAIKEEFDLAIEANTAEALQLFIQRHPEHPLAVEATILLRKAIEKKD